MHFSITEKQILSFSNPSLVNNQRNQYQRERETVAALKIQKTWNQFKKRSLLRASEEAAGPWLNRIVHYDGRGVERAENGKMPVFFPTGLPLVVKVCQKSTALERLQRMKEARGLCEREGFQRLIIPKSRICEIDYRTVLLERKVPIMHKTKEQIGLYIENRDRFTQVVKEFCYFHYKSDFRYLHSTNASRQPYQCFARTPIGRYDNVAFFLENGQGKIALIDLERFHLLNSNSRYSPKEKCIDLICLFPLHFQEILAIAREFNSQLQREHFLIYVRESLNRFDRVYHSHLKFLNTIGVGIANPTELKAGLEEKRKEELWSCVREELILQYGIEKFEAHEEGFYQDHFPEIVDAIFVFMEFFLNRKHQDQTQVSSFVELLSLRTLEFSNRDPLFVECLSILASNLILFEEEHPETHDVKSSMKLFDVILNAMQAKEIAYYNSSFGSKRCIFC